MIKYLIPLLALLGCTLDEADGSPYFGTVCALVLSPVPELSEGTTAGATRWTNATGCDVHTGRGGLPVRFGTDEELFFNGKSHVGVSHSNEDTGKFEYIAFRPGITELQDINTILTHEMGHVLGCHIHTTSGSIMDSPAWVDSKITADALECVCSVSHCLFMESE